MNQTCDYALYIRTLPIYVLPRPGPPRRARRPAPWLTHETALIGDFEVVEAEETVARSWREEEAAAEGEGATTATNVGVGVGFTDDHYKEGEDNDCGAFAFYLAESVAPRSPCTSPALSKSLEHVAGASALASSPHSQRMKASPRRVSMNDLKRPTPSRGFTWNEGEGGGRRELHGGV
jgi:hypothetical protein